MINNGEFKESIYVGENFKENKTMYKVIVFFPDGRTIFMSYNQEDDRKRDDSYYNHKMHLFRALELGGLDISKIKSKNRYEIYEYVMNQGISFLIDVGDVDSTGTPIDLRMGQVIVFYKGKELTNKQKEALMELERIYSNYKCRFGIYTLKDDEVIDIDKDEDIFRKFKTDKNGYFNYIIPRKKRAEGDLLSLQEFFNILDIIPRGLAKDDERFN